jgi:hypothetical protein
MSYLSSHDANIPSTQPQPSSQVSQEMSPLMLQGLSPSPDRWGHTTASQACISIFRDLHSGTAVKMERHRTKGRRK